MQGCKHAISDDGESTSAAETLQLKSCISRSFQVIDVSNLFFFFFPHNVSITLFNPMSGLKLRFHPNMYHMEMELIFGSLWKSMKAL